MRTHIIIAVVVVLGFANANAQNSGPVSFRKAFPTDNRPLSGEEWRLKLIERLMSLPSPVTEGAVQLYGMGDEAAVDVLKVLSTKPAPTAGEIEAALDIVHMAFEHPESIISDVNQKPQAASFLLQYFDSRTNDGNVKQRIKGVSTRLQAAAAAAAAKSATSRK
jgi:hypothetical protein